MTWEWPSYRKFRKTKLWQEEQSTDSTSKQGDSSNVLEEKQWHLTDVGSGSAEVLKIAVIC